MTNLRIVGEVSGGTGACDKDEIAFTRSGFAFKPFEDLWRWRDGTFRLRLDFHKLSLPEVFPLFALKKTLSVFARTNSSPYVNNLFSAFVHFLKLLNDKKLTAITAQDVSTYAARLQAHEMWRLAPINALLQKWDALGLPGIAPGCTQYLKEKRIQGAIKGEAVRTRDPVHGPFSEAEYKALYKAADSAYGQGELPSWVLVLTRLLYATGGRISQFAALKVKDVVFEEGRFCIRLPQAKKRTIHVRTVLKLFNLSPQTWRFTQSYIVTLMVNGYGPDSPLFPVQLVMKKCSMQAGRSESDIFYGHCLGESLSKAYSIAMADIAPPTERLGFKSIPVATRRFRYTFGTRLAEEGASKTVIADRLGHSDLQNVDVYFEASPRIIKNIDKAMDTQLAPLARAFKGKLVENERHSTLQGAPGSRIIDFRTSHAGVGSCQGKGQGCAFNKPVACYTCFKFEPWLDAPHEKVLAHLQTERAKWLNDERLAAINDDAIQAVQEVIAECAIAREQRNS